MRPHETVATASAGQQGPAQTDWLDCLGEQARSWYLTAGRLRDQGRLALVGDLLARASQLEPGSRQLREAAARAQFAAGQYLGAQASFAAMAAIAPRDELAQFALALCEACLGDLESAVRRLTLLAKSRSDVPRFALARAAVSDLLAREQGPRVRLPSYLQPPVAIAPELLALELGERPGPQAPVTDAHR
jgi:tetratricopeptide (TPR) repeat protein